MPCTPTTAPLTPPPCRNWDHSSSSSRPDESPSAHNQSVLETTSPQHTSPYYYMMYPPYSHYTPPPTPIVYQASPPIIGGSFSKLCGVAPALPTQPSYVPNPATLNLHTYVPPSSPAPITSVIPPPYTAVVSVNSPSSCLQVNKTGAVTIAGAMAAVHTVPSPISTPAAAATTTTTPSPQNNSCATSSDYTSLFHLASDVTPPPISVETPLQRGVVPPPPPPPSSPSPLVSPRSLVLAPLVPVSCVCSSLDSAATQYSCTPMMKHVTTVQSTTSLQPQGIVPFPKHPSVI